MLAHLLAFVAVSALVIITPGPDTALTIRNSVSSGRRAGVCTGAGVAIGQLLWTIAASVGVIGVLVASEQAFTVLKLVGAAYLVYLGAHSLRAAVRRGIQPASAPAQRQVTATKALSQGLVNDLANPKMAAFFASLLPQFVSDSSVAAVQMLGFGALFSVMTFAWLSGYAFALQRFKHALRHGRARRVVDGLAGVVLVGFGIRLATSSAP